MDNANVAYQTAELGKVDIGGGGTIAYILSLFASSKKYSKITSSDVIFGAVVRLFKFVSTHTVKTI